MDKEEIKLLIEQIKDLENSSLQYIHYKYSLPYCEMENIETKEVHFEDGISCSKKIEINNKNFDCNEFKNK